MQIYNVHKVKHASIGGASRNLFSLL